MAKDKLITIRIEDLKREAFKNWANSKKLDVSAFLHDVIDACLDGRIDEKIISSNRLDSTQGKILNDRLDIIEKRLASLTSQLDVYIDKQLDVYCREIDKKIDERLVKYENEIERLRLEFNRSQIELSVLKSDLSVDSSIDLSIDSSIDSIKQEKPISQEGEQESKKLISQEDNQEDKQEVSQKIQDSFSQEDAQEDAQEDKTDNSPDKDSSKISYSASELAKLTGFNRNTLAGWLKKGKIPRSRKNKFIIERYRMESNKFVPRALR